ncbi:MAG: ATP-binding cassette domain-containing protein [Pseudomonadota bacterium]
MSDAFIKVENLEKQFQVALRQPGLWGALKGVVSRRYRSVDALHGVSFEIERGELVGYIGPNGAGKSTTIKILSGILVPSGGRCEVAGLVPWQDRVGHVGRIGVVFGQRTQLWWDLPVIESFELLRDIYRVTPVDYGRARDELVALLDLEALLDVPVRQLSLGQRMRADLAASLLHDPDILFLDEPTIGLDAVSKLAMRSFVKRRNAERGTTVLLTTHDMDDVEALCSRVMLINHGALLMDGTVADLKSDRRRVIVDFLEAPVLEAAHAALVQSQSGERVTFEVATGVAAFVAELTSRYAIHDLTVEHPPIEETVAALYAQTADGQLPAPRESLSGTAVGERDARDG